MSIKLRDYQQELVDNVRQSYMGGARSPCIVLGCGGGKTVVFAYMAKKSQEKGNTVWFLVHRRELLDQTVATFDNFNIERKTIHIAMVGTVSRNLHKLPKPDFIIFDECHFSAAKTWRRIIDAFPDALLAGLTATPTRLDGKPLGNIYDDLVEGESIGSLIKKGHLAPYKYYAPRVADLSSLKKVRGDFDKAKAAELLSTKAVFGDVIEHYKNHAYGKQTICYCATIAHSEMMAKEFQEHGINAVHFDGDTPPKEREEIIKKFRKGEITVLCNVDLISVGFDMPDVDCCILLRPTDSTALYIQQACRALRFREGKTAVILDHVNNYERHGLPDDERNWSLEGKFEKPKRFDDEGMLKVRQCINCFGVFETGPSKCPHCGHEVKLEQQELKNIKEIELEEIKQQRKVEAEKIVLDFTTPEECNSLEELHAYARRNNYKNGWVFYQARARGWM